MTPTRIKPGESGLAKMPYSEVCMSMRVAGHYMSFHFLKNGRSVQLYKDGSPYSGTITIGEAGIYSDDEGYYYYP